MDLYDEKNMPDDYHTVGVYWRNAIQQQSDQARQSFPHEAAHLLGNHLLCNTGDTDSYKSLRLLSRSFRDAIDSPADTLLYRLRDHGVHKMKKLFVQIHEGILDTNEAAPIMSALRTVLKSDVESAKILAGSIHRIVINGGLREPVAEHTLVVLSLLAQHANQLLDLEVDIAALRGLPDDQSMSELRQFRLRSLTVSFNSVQTKDDTIVLEEPFTLNDFSNLAIILTTLSSGPSQSTLTRLSLQIALNFANTNFEILVEMMNRFRFLQALEIFVEDPVPLLDALLNQTINDRRRNCLSSDID